MGMEVAVEFGIMRRELEQGWGGRYKSYGMNWTLRVPCRKWQNTNPQSKFKFFASGL